MIRNVTWKYYIIQILYLHKNIRKLLIIVMPLFRRVPSKFIKYILSSNQEFHFNFHLSYRTNSLIRKYVVSLINTDKHYILNTISFYLRETDSKHYFFCPVSFDLKLAIHGTFYTFNCFITKNVEAIFDYLIYILC